MCQPSRKTEKADNMMNERAQTLSFDTLIDVFFDEKGRQTCLIDLFYYLIIINI